MPKALSVGLLVGFWCGDKRFLKKINENEYLGFEIDIRELKNDTKKFGPNIIEANIIYILKTEKIQNEEKKIEIFEIKK